MSGPSRARMVAFLLSPAVLRPDGAVLSWASDDGTAYAYPEAAGLVLSALALHAPEAREPRARVAAWLWARRGPLGGFGRDGVEYAFDTAIVLRGLVSHALASPPDEGETWRARAEELAAPLERALDAGSPFLDPALALEPHWSRAAGPHLLKCCLALRALEAGRRARPARRALEARLVERLLPLESGGRWRESAGSSRSYVHAQAYALEGLVALEAPREPALADVLARGVEHLARIQRPSGALPAWDDAAETEERADATAQALRLWSCVDARAFGRPIALARAFLARAQAPSGGVRYTPHRAHVNTWCTTFALQAEAWSERGTPSPRELY